MQYKAVVVTFLVVYQYCVVYNMHSQVLKFNKLFQWTPGNLARGRILRTWYHGIFGIHPSPTSITYQKFDYLGSVIFNLDV